MEIRPIRLATAALVFATSLFGASSSLATSFTVHGYDLGENIALVGGQRVWTAELDVSLEGVADHTTSFCVDLYSSIGPGNFTVANVLDAYSSPSPAGGDAPKPRLGGSCDGELWQGRPARDRRHYP